MNFTNNKQNIKPDKAYSKILSLRGAIEKSNVSHTLNSIHNSMYAAKEEIEHEDDSQGKSQIHTGEEKKQVITKYKLNIDTDSEDDEIDICFITPFTNKGNEQGQQVNSHKQKGFYDYQTEHGAEQTKAKQNVNFLLGLVDKNSILPPAQKPPLKKGEKFGNQSQQQAAGVNQFSITAANSNPQAPLNPQITSLSNKGAEGKCASQCNSNRQINLQNVMVISPKEQNSDIQNNCSFMYEENEESIVFLKGLSQNQELGEMCELNESIQNEKMSIDIKTTDFFTFIRLQDEVDELRRKQIDFQKKKEMNLRNHISASVNQFNQQSQQKQQNNLSQLDSNQKIKTIQRQNDQKQARFGQIGASDRLHNTLTKVITEQSKLNNEDQMMNKTEGQAIYLEVQARKFGNLLINKSKERKKQKLINDFIQEHEAHLAAAKQEQSYESQSEEDNA